MYLYDFFINVLNIFLLVQSSHKRKRKTKHKREYIFKPIYHEFRKSAVKIPSLRIIAEWDTAHACVSIILWFIYTITNWEGSTCESHGFWILSTLYNNFRYSIFFSFI